MGDLFWNKLAGVVIGGVLLVMVIMELGHTLVPSHGAGELTAENTSYPVDWAALGAGSTGVVEEVETGPVDYSVVLAALDISAGERVFRRCAACHTVDEGGAHGVGPNLWDVVNRARNSIAAFGYSGAIPEGSWTFEALDQFIENPQAYAPGTAMNFRGLSNDEQRYALLGYLRSLSANPAPLPAPPPELQEAVDQLVNELNAGAAAVDDAMATAEDADAGDMAEAMNDDAATAAEAMADEALEEAVEAASDEQ